MMYLMGKSKYASEKEVLTAIIQSYSIIDEGDLMNKSGEF